MKKFFLFLIPFLFLSCQTNTSSMVLIKNLTGEDQFYYSTENPSKVYNLDNNDTIRFTLSDGYAIELLNTSDDIKLNLERVPVSGTSADCYTFYNINDYKHVVINSYDVPIIFYYDNTNVTIEAKSSYTYYSFKNDYSFYFIVGCELVKGKNKDLTVH